MKNYRTAMGKVIDMAALAAKNETVRAVGNMDVNARGDTIDPQGNVIKPVTAKVNDKYNKTVGNPSAQVRKSNVPNETKAPAVKPTDLELTELEKELEASFEDDLEVEKIKQEELKAQTKKGKK